MIERLKDLIKVILMIGLCIVSIIFIYKAEEKIILSNHNTIYSHDTIPSIPAFMTLTAEEGLIDALEYYNIQHSNIVYAQALLETGNFKSAGCLEYNNLFGLYNSRINEYYKFNHWSESVVFYKEQIQKRYKPPEDYYTFLQRIGYAEDPKYIYKLKQIVNSNDERTSLGGGKNYS